MTETPRHSRLRLVRAGIDTYQQPVVYMHRDCAVCRSEGFAALTRVHLRVGEKELKRHNRKGIFTLTQLSCTFRSRKKAGRRARSPPSPPVAISSRWLRPGLTWSSSGARTTRSSSTPSRARHGR